MHDVPATWTVIGTQNDDLGLIVLVISNDFVEYDVFDSDHSVDHLCLNRQLSFFRDEYLVHGLSLSEFVIDRH